MDDFAPYGRKIVHYFSKKSKDEPAKTQQGGQEDDFADFIRMHGGIDRWKKFCPFFHPSTLENFLLTEETC